MKPHDRKVAGIRCSELLEDLSAYMDDELAAQRVARIEAHLRGCDWCEEFGERFTSTIAALRHQLGDAAPLEAAVRGRLRARVNAEATSDLD